MYESVHSETKLIVMTSQISFMKMELSKQSAVLYNKILDCFYIMKNVLSNYYQLFIYLSLKALSQSSLSTCGAG